MSEPQRTTLRRTLAFTATTLALAATWLIALPRLASTKPVADHIAQQERLGIDPSAMFYTELEIAPTIAHKAERRSAAEGWTFDGPATEVLADGR